jgi:spore germination cell wall hydrolase CwlJ-like protein
MKAIIIVMATMATMLSAINPAEAMPTPTPAPTVRATPAPSSDVELLAGIIWQEARGESDRGQQAVGEVVMNRVRSPRFPNSIAAVYAQRGQFSGYGRAMWPTERERRNARLVLEGKADILPDDVVYFSREPQPGKAVWGWIGRHCFCRE